MRRSSLLGLLRIHVLLLVQIWERRARSHEKIKDAGVFGIEMNEEREVYSMKGKKVLSGLLSLLTILTSVIQPVVTYATEPEPPAYEAQYPSLETVQEFLDAEEIVTAEDYEVEAGSGFNVKSDFSRLEINDEKVRVSFHEAKNEVGQDYDGNHADTYRAVYFVEPASGHLSYHICRNIIVKEPAAEKQSENQTDSSASSEESTESEGEDEDAEQELQTEPETGKVTELPEETEILSEEALDAALEENEGQKTVDKESGLTLGEVLLQAEDQGIDIQGLENGESVSFAAQVPAARASQSVTITQGSYYYYADYGLGSYVSAPFTVSFGNVTATAYCIQPSKPGPGSGTYQITKLEGNRELTKVEVIKVDSNHSDARLDGVVFGIYSDKDCTKLIT